MLRGQLGGNRVLQKDGNVFEGSLRGIFLVSHAALAPLPLQNIGCRVAVRIFLVFSGHLPLLAFRALDVAELTIAIRTKCFGTLGKGLDDAIVSRMGKIGQGILPGLPHDFDFFVPIIIVV